MRRSSHDSVDYSALQRMQWLVAIGSAALLAIFAISEWDGLRALIDLLANTITSTPDYIQAVIDYYEQLSGDQLAPAVVRGALLGGALTAWLVLHQRGFFRIPGAGRIVALTVGLILLYVSATAWSSRLGIQDMVADLATWLDANFVLGMLLLLGIAFLINLLWSRERWRTFKTDDVRGIVTPQGMRTLLIAGGIGAVAGAFGSQLLMYPTQHCTYAPEVDPVQYRLGVMMTLIGMGMALLPVWTVLLREKGDLTRQGTAGFFRGWSLPYALLTPTLLILIVFLYYPGMQILTLSLKLRRNPLPQERFVCLDNYIALANDTVYQNSFTVTMLITIALVIFTMSAALLIATLASLKIQGAGIYRTLLIWPFALSPVVSGVIFLTMFREGGAGVVNYGLESLFGIEPRWLRDPDLAPWVVILASIWNGLGFNILFYIAGLQNVPQDLLEAASIDGANATRRFFSITVPLLSPFTFFLLVTNVTYAFYGIYGVIDSITRGGPPLGPGGVDGGATDVLIFKLYEDAFGAGGSAGLAAAQALILFLLVAGITLIQFRYVENRVTYSA